MLRPTTSRGQLVLPLLANGVTSPPATTQIEHPPRAPLLLLRIDVLAREMAQLELDEIGLARWAGMSPRSVREILRTGTATRISLRRLRRGLRLAWTNKVGVVGGADVEHWRRLTFKYLTADEAS